jgi:hypothetical protein
MKRCAVAKYSPVAQESIMESSRRYRLLIIFAALIFCLTVCFANAEVSTVTLATGTQDASSTSMHANFLTPLQQDLLPTTGTIQNLSATAPVISQALVNTLTRNAQKSHGFWHGISLMHPKPGLVMHRSMDRSAGDAAEIPGAGIVPGASTANAGQGEQTE